VQEAVAVALRRALPLSLDDLLALAIGLEPMAPRRRGLRDLRRACPIRIGIIRTDHGKAFTDRLFGLRRRAATGVHAFGRLCAQPGIERCLTPPASHRTSGMVERFNGRIEAVLQSRRVRSGEEPETTLHRTVRLCNRQMPQSDLGQQVALAGDEGLAQTQAAALQKAATPPSGM
jgi:transposase InsO family protein